MDPGGTIWFYFIYKPTQFNVCLFSLNGININAAWNSRQNLVRIKSLFHSLENEVGTIFRCKDRNVGLKKCNTLVPIR